MKNILFTTTMVGLTLFLNSCSNHTTESSLNKEEISKMSMQLEEFVAGNERIANYISTFDELDFIVFSNQEWNRLHESHAQNIKVNWPDGHQAIGIERHIEDLKPLFVHAPNTEIKEHPIKFGSVNMTAVIGYMTGTFTEPMPDGTGGFIQPTGKSFRLPMCTIGIWENGVMIEEYLFWDNQTYMKQLGL